MRSEKLMRERAGWCCERLRGLCRLSCVLATWCFNTLKGARLERGVQISRSRRIRFMGYFIVLARSLAVDVTWSEAGCLPSYNISTLVPYGLSFWILWHVEQTKILFLTPT